MNRENDGSSVAMKGIVSLLLMCFLLMACRKNEPAAAQVVPVIEAAPKVKAETIEKVERFFLALNQVEMKLLSSSVNESIAAVSTVKPELEMLDRALLRDLPHEYYGQWETIKGMIRDVLLWQLAYVSLCNEQRQGDYTTGIEVRRICPDALLKMKKWNEDGIYEISSNKKILMEQIKRMRENALVAWDKMLK